MSPLCRSEHASVAEIDAFYEDYEFAKATEALYHLVWDEFCDWYLELAKPQVPACRPGRYGRLGWTSWLGAPAG